MKGDFDFDLIWWVLIQWPFFLLYATRLVAGEAGSTVVLFGFDRSFRVDSVGSGM